MGIRKFHCRQSKVTKVEKIDLNQSFMCIHHFPPLSFLLFLFVSLLLSSQKKLFFGRKNIGGAFSPTTPVASIR
jgi:hypothetical protein